MSWHAFGCLSKNAIRLLSLFSHNTSCHLNLGSMPLVGLLSRSVGELGNMGPIGVYMIYNKTAYMLLLIPKHFFTVHSANFMILLLVCCFGGCKMMTWHDIC